MSLVNLEQSILAEIDAATDEASLEAVRVSVLGKKGSISERMKSLGAMSPEERKDAGAALLWPVRFEPGRNLFDPRDLTWATPAGKLSVGLQLIAPPGDLAFEKFLRPSKPVKAQTAVIEVTQSSRALSDSQAHPVPDRWRCRMEMG